MTFVIIREMRQSIITVFLDTVMDSECVSMQSVSTPTLRRSSFLRRKLQARNTAIRRLGNSGWMLRTSRG